MVDKQPSEIIAEGQFGVVEFKKQAVRRVLHNGEWHFSVIDVIAALTETDRPRKYWNDLKAKLVQEEGFDELSDKIGQLKMPAPDGKERRTDAANVETMFRVIQSVPSKKAEPFKRWLAKVGYERILETQNPEIAVKRAILNYKKKGYDDKWIDGRIRSIFDRNSLTSEWAGRGVRKRHQYGQLTNLVHQMTFDLSVREHKAVKGLQERQQNLRDHMTSTELIFTMLAETSTKAIADSSNARGFKQNRKAAEQGGGLAGDARRALEAATGQRVVSTDNFLPKVPDLEVLTA